MIEKASQKTLDRLEVLVFSNRKDENELKKTEASLNYAWVCINTPDNDYWVNPQPLALRKKMIFYPVPSSCKSCKESALEGGNDRAWRLLGSSIPEVLVHTTVQRIIVKPPWFIPGHSIFQYEKVYE